MKNVLVWLQQPTSVAGVSAVIGTISAMGLHQLTLAQAAPLLAGAIASILLPDNAGAKGAAEILAREAAAAISTSREKSV